MEKNAIAFLEKELEITQPAVTTEQMQAAYALNLCAVSVSQIIDYNDINVLEQEYESILNNLNLEHIPKDEALLDILKRLLETITFFRIQEGDKQLIEKDYQQKMKNAIWSAMPNPGALIGAGLSTGGVGFAISLAASVGTAYMNYRKNKAEFQQEKERQYWELKKTAIEQFQSLQQQLFETSWRLADKYGFPDCLRVTERQIKQYNVILMDTDEIRKFERLYAIRHKFAAYPPFWYFFGSTANSISMSMHYGLDRAGKEHYREYAKKCFEYFSIVNRYDLLREDGITASCYLEYVDLLDATSEKTKIRELLAKAVEAAGNAFDILQLCAIAYVKIGDTDNASEILRRLVNEQYNDVINAQILSSLYVRKYIETQDTESRTAYKILQSRVDPAYLFPWPDKISGMDIRELENGFINKQRHILRTKYRLVLEQFIKKYEARINRIIPVPEDFEHPVSDMVYAVNRSAREERIRSVQLVLCNSSKSDSYKAAVQQIPYSYEILKTLNQMFASICMLDCIQNESVRDELQEIIKQAINKNRIKIQNADKGIAVFDEKVYEDIQKITLETIISDFFIKLAKIIIRSVNAIAEMRDFAIAEYNLIQFCKEEGMENPELLFAHRNDADKEDVQTVYFTPDLIGESAITQNARFQKNKKMMDIIRNSIAGVVLNTEEIEFYMQEDPRVSRYFYGKTFESFRSKTFAVIDDRTKGDMDILFTSEGLMPIIKGRAKAVVPYHEIHWSKNGKKKELEIRTKYSNQNLDMDKLYDLICELAQHEVKQEQHVFDDLNSSAQSSFS